MKLHEFVDISGFGALMEFVELWDISEMMALLEMTALKEPKECREFT